MTSSADLEKFRELVSSFETCLFVSHDARGAPRGRPMHIAELEGSGRLLFATSLAGTLAEDIVRDDRVALTFQSDARFLSLHGSATLTTDRRQVQAAFRESWRAWFPEGPDDPSLCLVEVYPDDVEVWDARGKNGLKMLFATVKAAVTGAKVEAPRELHQHLHP
jgi:general stress protein 26